MSWDIDFEEDTSFVTGFEDSDSLFFDPLNGSQPSSFGQTNFDAVTEMQTETTQIAPQPLQQISLQTPSPNAQLQPPSANLAQENDQLRQFFTSLKEKAAQAESLNQSLKTQLEDCRNWFKNAMFFGFSNKQ